MNLNFSVLWFDDDKDYFDSFDFTPIESEIRSWGFNPQITTVTEPDEFMGFSPWHQYDLIVVDFTLENHHASGGDFISQVRENQAFTEVIFYSSKNNTELWKEIESRKLEGVYVANRGQIGPKIVRIAKHSVSKVLDLENMRGIVMAEVGELDHLLDKIFVSAMSKLAEEVRKTILIAGHESIKKQSDDRHAALDTFIENPSIEGLLKMCDSNKRWQNFRRVSKHHTALKEIVTGDYVVEILNKRNFLAHGIPTPHEEGGHTFCHNGSDYYFNDEESLTLRQMMNKYRSTFNQAIEHLNTLE